MNADIKLSPYQIGRTGFPLLWAPVFLRPDTARQGYFHLYPPLASQHPHAVRYKEQATRLAAALERRNEDGT